MAPAIAGGQPAARMSLGTSKETLMSSFVRNPIVNSALAASAIALSLLCSGSGARAEVSAHGQPAPSASSAPASTPSGVVNINTATADELTRLPGVGPGRAKAILELRGRIKRFEKVDDLMRVKGIGRATFRKLRPMLTIEGATTMQARTASRARHGGAHPST
ncbi:MAG TPA: helix-hairpin-helix domain-containing protein [Polyangiales bacterium]|jgi:competence protein ComEA|nr:helix-hairpin-helix domain-containing protein [Polyangiales bacterium]